MPTTRTILPYILAPILLLGPLYAYYLDDELPLQATSPDSIPARIHKSIQNLSLISIRNYVIVRNTSSHADKEGPLTEELTFRSSLIAVALLAGLSPKAIVFGTPLWFGIAHAHHAVEVWRKGGSTRSAAIQALAGSSESATSSHSLCS
jgi:prenyl protein peptidase